MAPATDQHVRLTGGTLYPLLHRLEAEGLIKGENQENDGQIRRWYRVTRAGQRRLDQQRSQWNLLRQCLGRLVEKGDVPTKTPELG